MAGYFFAGPGFQDASTQSLIGNWELAIIIDLCLVLRFEETIQSSIPTMLNPQITEWSFKNTQHPVRWINSLRIRCTVGIFKQALKAQPLQHSPALHIRRWQEVAEVVLQMRTFCQLLRSRIISSICVTFGVHGAQFQIDTCGFHSS